MTKNRMDQLLDSINAKPSAEPLTLEEVEALFLWSGYSDAEDLADYDAVDAKSARS